MTKHEELVEEISERIQFVADIGMQNFRATSAHEWAFEKEKRGLTLARELITLVLSAFHDGRLELLGEAWRAQAWVEDGIEYFPRGRVEVRPPIDALENFPRMTGFDVIALRKEEDRVV